MIVSLIAAVAENGVIGRDGDLPWQIRDDMRFFVRTTKGHCVITGRRNFDAMGKALPGRRNLIISRDAQLKRPSAETFVRVQDALVAAERGGEEEAFVIGGAEIYSLAFPFASRVYLTTVLADVPGDTHFPAFDRTQFTVTELLRGERDEHNEHPFVVHLLARIEAPEPYAP